MKGMENIPNATKDPARKEVDKIIQTQAFEELCKEAQLKYLQGRKFRRFVFNRMDKRIQKIIKDKSIQREKHENKS